MNNYKDSDYALNKYSEGIVYRFADGIAEITLTDYLAENTGNTEADFRAIKELSDSIYSKQVKDENRQTYKNTPFDELDESVLYQMSSPEEVFIGEIDALEESEQRLKLLTAANSVLNKLTEIQRRRYLMYRVNGLTLRQIADIEGVLFTKIYKSVEAAEKKIKKILSSG